MVQTRPPKAITIAGDPAKGRANAFSFIRTVTVGSGIAPDLLTPPAWGPLAGSADRTAIPPVGNFAPP